MTTLHLVRHGANDSLAAHRLAGRAPGTLLNGEGRAQAAALAASLASVPFAAVLSSPLERCRETAEILAAPHGLTVETRDGLLELDFGEWTGKATDEIRGDPLWERFNRFRAGTGAPGGETLAEATARVLRVALDARDGWPEGHVALVGHGDPLRGLLLHLLGMPDEGVFRIELAPCGRAVVELGPWGARLVRLDPSPALSKPESTGSSSALG